MENFITIFSAIEDKRIERAKKHKLIDIITIAFCAVLCGSKSWYEIEEFGIVREMWLRKYLELPNGIPSHDTFGRVLGLLDPGVLEEKLMEWMRSVFVKKPERVIAIDGKTIRGTLDKGDKAFVHMVSAWSCENGVSLAQLAVDEKSNEITAMPKLLDMLNIRGAVITSDAMGCQRELAGLIKQKGGEYILAVKGNQKLLMEGIEESCALLSPVSRHTETDCGHGRVEVRTCSVYRDLSMVPGAWNWDGLAALVRVVSTRHNKKTRAETSETRYYITSLRRCSAAFIATCIRQHWQVENNLHWVLDFCFQEDTVRKAFQNSAQNFSRLNRMALAVVKNTPVPCGRIKSLKGKRLRAAWSVEFLEQLLINL